MHNEYNIVIYGFWIKCKVFVCGKRAYITRNDGPYTTNETIHSHIIQCSCLDECAEDAGWMWIKDRMESKPYTRTEVRKKRKAYFPLGRLSCACGFFLFCRGERSKFRGVDTEDLFFKYFVYLYTAAAMH